MAIKDNITSSLMTSPPDIEAITVRILISTQLSYVLFTYRLIPVTIITALSFNIYLIYQTTKVPLSYSSWRF